MKWYGKVGYYIPIETAPGVWKDRIVEKYYYGDAYKSPTARWNDIPINSGNTINKTPMLKIDISILADSTAYNNFMHIKYIEYMGELYTIASVTPQRPRILLSVGELYSGPTGEENDD